MKNMYIGWFSFVAATLLVSSLATGCGGNDVLNTSGDGAVTMMDGGTVDGMVADMGGTDAGTCVRVSEVSCPGQSCLYWSKVGNSVNVTNNTGASISIVSLQVFSTSDPINTVGNFFDPINSYGPINPLTDLPYTYSAPITITNGSSAEVIKNGLTYAPTKSAINITLCYH